MLTAATIALPGLAQAQQPIVIKFSHVVAPDTPKGKGADPVPGGDEARH